MWNKVDIVGDALSGNLYADAHLLNSASVILSAVKQHLLGVGKTPNRSFKCCLTGYDYRNHATMFCLTRTSIRELTFKETALSNG